MDVELFLPKGILSLLCYTRTVSKIYPRYDSVQFTRNKNFYTNIQTKIFLLPPICSLARLPNTSSQFLLAGFQKNLPDKLFLLFLPVRY